MLIAIVCKTCQGKNAIGAKIENKNSMAELLQPHTKHNHIVPEIRIYPLANSNNITLCISVRVCECWCVEVRSFLNNVFWDLGMEIFEIYHHCDNPGRENAAASKKTSPEISEVIASHFSRFYQT